jgi:hypothetical protein
MPRPEKKEPRIIHCEHEWRLCKGTNLKECSRCFDMVEV